MSISCVERLAADIDQLSLNDQLWLIEHLAHRIRHATLRIPHIPESDLTAMANDPDIQQELRQIETEFVTTESDGLDRLP